MVYKEGRRQAEFRLIIFSDFCSDRRWRAGEVHRKKKKCMDGWMGGRQSRLIYLLACLFGLFLGLGVGGFPRGTTAD